MRDRSARTSPPACSACALASTQLKRAIRLRNGLRRRRANWTSATKRAPACASRRALRRHWHHFAHAHGRAGSRPPFGRSSAAEAREAHRRD
jgi:hypothetical protein